MITNLWLLNLFLAANTLMLLATLTYAWIYYDLFHKEGIRNSLWVANGALLMAVSWLLNVLSINLSNELLPLLRFSFLTLGLLLLLIGHWKERIPGLPKLNIKPNVAHSIVPLTLVLLAPSNLVLAGLICVRLYKKITAGKSKQFTRLFGAWVLLLGYFLFAAMSGVAHSGSLWLQDLTRDFTTLWILAHALLLFAALTLLNWIGSFLSFRVVAKLFVSIWQQLIVYAIVLACAYSIFTIHTAKKQMFTLLGHNIELINFNLGQISTNNLDLLGYLASDPSIQTGLTENPAGLLESKSSDFLRTNSTLDQIIFVNADRQILYDSLDERNIGLTVKSMDSFDGFVIADDLPAVGKLEYHVIVPVVRDQQTIGALIAIKQIDDSFLDLLKSQTGQEVLVYVNGSRAASTIVANDQLSRLENLPLLTTNIDTTSANDNVNFAETRILDTPYLIYQLLLNTDSGPAEIILATKQSILLASSKQALMYTFLLAVLLSLLTLLPSYRLARTVEASARA